MVPLCLKKSSAASVTDSSATEASGWRIRYSHWVWWGGEGGGETERGVVGRGGGEGETERGVVGRGGGRRDRERCSGGGGRRDRERCSGEGREEERQREV